MICADGGQGLIAALPMVYPGIPLQRCWAPGAASFFLPTAERLHLVKELLHYGDDVTAFGRLPQSDVWCPKSGDGRSVRRENTQDQSLFYGYSHYPYCDPTQPACPPLQNRITGQSRWHLPLP